MGAFSRQICHCSTFRCRGRRVTSVSAAAATNTTTAGTATATSSAIGYRTVVKSRIYFYHTMSPPQPGKRSAEEDVQNVKKSKKDEEPTAEGEEEDLEEEEDEDLEPHPHHPADVHLHLCLGPRYAGRVAAVGAVAHFVKCCGVR